MEQTCTTSPKQQPCKTKSRTTRRIVLHTYPVYTSSSTTNSAPVLEDTGNILTRVSSDIPNPHMRIPTISAKTTQYTVHAVSQSYLCFILSWCHESHPICYVVLRGWCPSRSTELKRTGGWSVRISWCYGSPTLMEYYSVYTGALQFYYIVLLLQSGQNVEKYCWRNDESIMNFHQTRDYRQQKQ